MSKSKVDYLKLVETNGSFIFCDSRMVAEKFSIPHARVVRTIERNKDKYCQGVQRKPSDISFNPIFIEFQDSYQGQNFKAYKMNRDAFIIIAMRFVTPNAIEWQKKFLTAFKQMESKISQLEINKKNQEWIETRKSGKLIRNTETDTVKLFIDYATEQGSSNAKFYYTNISKMQNKALFLLDQKYKNVRELLDVEQLWTIASADKIVIKALKDGMERKLNYKDIYQLAKTNVETFAAIHGKSAIPDTKLRLVG